MNQRIPFLAIFLCCAVLLAFGYYLQFAKGLEPCPLCIIQRLFFIGVGMIALIADLHRPDGFARRAYAGILATISLGGGLVATRQVWLQHLPEEKIPECGPDLAFMMELYEPLEIVQWLYKGTGDCAEVNWTFLTFSLAEWSLAWFIGFMLAGIVMSVRR